MIPRLDVLAILLSGAAIGGCGGPVVCVTGQFSADAVPKPGCQSARAARLDLHNRCATDFEIVALSYTGSGPMLRPTEDSARSMLLAGGSHSVPLTVDALDGGAGVGSFTVQLSFTAGLLVAVEVPVAVSIPARLSDTITYRAAPALDFLVAFSTLDAAHTAQAKDRFTDLFSYLDTFHVPFYRLHFIAERQGVIRPLQATDGNPYVESAESNFLSEASRLLDDAATQPIHSSIPDAFVRMVDPQHLQSNSILVFVSFTDGTDAVTLAPPAWFSAVALGRPDINVSYLAYIVGADCPVQVGDQLGGLLTFKGTPPIQLCDPNTAKLSSTIPADFANPISITLEHAFLPSLTVVGDGLPIPSSFDGKPQWQIEARTVTLLSNLLARVRTVSIEFERESNCSAAP